MCGNSDSDVYEIETRSFKLMLSYKTLVRNQMKKRKQINSRFFVHLAEANRTTLNPCELKNEK